MKQTTYMKASSALEDEKLKEAAVKVALAPKEKRTYASQEPAREWSPTRSADRSWSFDLKNGL